MKRTMLVAMSAWITNRRAGADPRAPAVGHDTPESRPIDATTRPTIPAAKQPAQAPVEPGWIFP